MIVVDINKKLTIVMIGCDNDISIIVLELISPNLMFSSIFRNLVLYKQT